MGRRFVSPVHRIHHFILFSLTVAPVPVGKRCLLVTDQSLGVPGLGEHFNLLRLGFPSILFSFEHFFEKPKTGQTSYASVPLDSPATDYFVGFHFHECRRN